MDCAIAEAGRVLAPGGRFCFAIVHPMISAGDFASDAADAALVLTEPYFKARPYVDRLERDGLPMSFHSVHRPLEAYAVALETAGFLIETIREPAPDDETVRQFPRMARWKRMPCFLHVRAVRQ